MSISLVGCASCWCLNRLRSNRHTTSKSTWMAGSTHVGVGAGSTSGSPSIEKSGTCSSCSRLSRGIKCLVLGILVCGGALSAEFLSARDLSGANVANASNKTCSELMEGVPPRVQPAIVLQLVSHGYWKMQRNFIRLMEANSVFTRQNLYLMCLDPESAEALTGIGVRCMSLAASNNELDHHYLWKLRAHALSCLLQGGFDVIVSDSDALWLDDPMKTLSSPEVRASSLVASRGKYPFTLAGEWGSTMCMGFALFRATGTGMEKFQRAMQRIVVETGDDQVALNTAAHELGIVWDKKSDMRYIKSVELGRGVIPMLGGNGDFTVTLLPHIAYTRVCKSMPISNRTVVAHCNSKKKAGAKASWMKTAKLWNVKMEHNK